MSLDEKLSRVQRRAAARNLVPSIHSGNKMREREITEQEIYEAIASGQILEDYTASECCLILGFSQAGRPLHIVCTTAGTLKIITLYEPKPPDWITPTERGTL